MVIFINYFGSKCDCYETEEDSTVDSLLEYVYKTKGYPKDIVKVVHSGHYVGSCHIIRNNSTVHIVLSLYGGKGGFGSMLRAIGAQIEKTTNREACRDLSGRRLRDINEEQRLKRWISKKAEREKEAMERKRRKLEQMCSLPKHDFHDAQYDRERRDLSERIDDSLTHGLKVATDNKRKLEHDLPSTKKSCLWIGVNVDDTEQSADEMISSDEDSLSVVDISKETSSTDKVTKECQDANCDYGSASRSDHDLLSSQHDVSVSTSEEGNKENDLSLETSSFDLMQSQKIDPEKSVDMEPFDLLSFQNCKELEQLGLDRLKQALQHLGMKCGGTLQQRAERLWLVRGVEPSNISPNLLAKPSKRFQ